MISKILALALITAGMAAQDNPIPRTTTVTVQGFKVELKRCEKVSTKIVTCYLVITNLQADRMLVLGGTGQPSHDVLASYYVDSGGMLVEGSSSQLGSSTKENYSQTELVTDTPARGRVEFAVGDPRATSLAKLAFGFRALTSFRAEFRKVPLEGN